MLDEWLGAPTLGVFIEARVTKSAYNCVMVDELKNDIQTAKNRDPAARSSLEVLLCYPGVHALFIHRIANKCWHAQWFTLGRFLSHLGRFLTGIEIHPGATVGRGVFIDHGMGVVIGETAVIGDDCTIYQGVTLGGTSLTKGAKRHPTLDKGVIIAAGAQVLGGFTVGAGARVGSNAVLLRAVPPGATAVGIPAKIIEESTSPAANEKTFDKLGFSAYGINPSDDDPMGKALRHLMGHVAKQDEQIERMRKELIRMGACVDEDCPPLDQPAINKMIS